jgi:hypothetical protein
VRRRIARRDRLVEPAPDDRPVEHDYRADRHLPGVARPNGLLERRRHPHVVRRRVRHAFDAAIGAIRPRADSRAPAAGTSRPTLPRPNAGIAP